MNSRSKNLKKNIIWLFVLKVAGIGVSFLVLPLTVNYLTAVEYGVWVTLFTAMNWVNILDFGVGLGMRNKLAAAVAENDIDKIKEYISTGMIFLIFVGCVIILVFIIIAQFVSFQMIFNTTDISEKDLYISSIIAGILIIITFSLSTINHIYFAYQKAFVTGMISITSSVLLMIGLLCLKKTECQGIIFFVIAFGSSLVLSRLIYCIVFFFERKTLIPSWHRFSIAALKKITSIGVKFFLIQICGILSLLMPNILITQLLGPEYVRTYDISFKLFNFVVVIQNIILSPLWSAYTAAYAQHDYKWMKNIYKKTTLLLIPLIVMLVLIGIYIQTVIYLWMDIYITVTEMLIIYMILYNIFSLISGNSCALLNGISRLDLQMIIAIIMATTTIPISYIAVKWLNMGLEGIIATMAFEVSLGAIFMSIQALRFFREMQG